MSSANERVFVGLGSNLGDRLALLQRSLLHLDSCRGVDVVEVSSLYETDPVGFLQQPKFFNAVAELRTTLAPEEFLERAQAIEHEMGRQRRLHWGPRRIDIDLLLWGERIIETPTLIIPHPELARRNFVLVPLVEIASEFRTPPDGVTVSRMLEECSDPSTAKKIAPPTVLWSSKQREVGVAP